jgi:hypothetical protein
MKLLHIREGQLDIEEIGTHGYKSATRFSVRSRPVPMKSAIELMISLDHLLKADVLSKANANWNGCHIRKPLAWTSAVVVAVHRGSLTSSLQNQR